MPEIRTDQFFILFWFGKATEIVSCDIASINSSRSFVILVVKTLSDKVVAGKVQDTSTAVSETAAAKQITVGEVVQFISLVQIEHALFTLTSLPFPRITFQHSVLQCHIWVGLSESSVLKRSSMITRLVFRQQLISTFIETCLLGSAWATSHTLEISASHIVLELRCQLQTDICNGDLPWFPSDQIC